MTTLQDLLNQINDIVAQSENPDILNVVITEDEEGFEKVDLDIYLYECLGYECVLININ